MKIEVTELEGSLIQSLRDSRTTILVNGKYPVKGIYQNTNNIIIESDIKDWHTGTPTEEGFFAVYYYADNEYDYGYADWNGKYWEEHFSFDDIGCRIIAWQKIDPYKEKKE